MKICQEKFRAFTSHIMQDTLPKYYWSDKWCKFTMKAETEEKYSLPSLPWNLSLFGIVLLVISWFLSFFFF